ncbi:MAG: stage IV sporulation protein A [Lachnospiraceae bacterium]|nr:stage IV sporulation protein A [Lachnospiraceae bacterium]
MNQETKFNLYRDIQNRTNGEIYLGVVGPVRTGKSTFIKRFMNLMVIPNIENDADKERAIDELPQSAGGTVIMTTEPKFIPKEAVEINVGVPIRVRLIDCVGFVVEGAGGVMEAEQERMVKTPWSSEEMPFSKAASIGTKKVIKDHSTIGIVLTCDGSFGEIPRNSYVAAEEEIIKDMERIQKPFVVVLNTMKPLSDDAALLAKSLREKYQVPVIPVNCEQLREEDVLHILKEALSIFPVQKLNFYLPNWVEILSDSHPIKEKIMHLIRLLVKDVDKMKDLNTGLLQRVKEEMAEPAFDVSIDAIKMESGEADLKIGLPNDIYYEVLSELSGVDIGGEYQLIQTLRELVLHKKEFEKMEDAYEQVRYSGYGVISPGAKEIQIEEPELIHHGNKYGVKIKASAPSIHMINANIETEIAPIVGNREQAEELVRYMEENAKDLPEGIWNTNIFGKTVGQMVEEGIRSKIVKLSEESRIKLQETLRKVVNDSNGGVIFIII